MRGLLRTFNKDNVDTILPDVSQIVAETQAQPAAAGAGAENGNQNGRGFNPAQRIPVGIMGQGGVPTSLEPPI